MCEWLVRRCRTRSVELCVLRVRLQSACGDERPKHAGPDSSQHWKSDCADVRSGLCRVVEAATGCYCMTRWLSAGGCGCTVTGYPAASLRRWATLRSFREFGARLRASVGVVLLWALSCMRPRVAVSEVYMRRDCFRVVVCLPLCMHSFPWLPLLLLHSLRVVPDVAAGVRSQLCPRMCCA
jgi:hypothetical protein